MATVSVPAGPPGRTRPDVLAYPSPTTSRYLIFVVALLAAGLFVGNYVHNIAWGESWTRTVSVCLNRTSGGTTAETLVWGSREFSTCTADAERTRAGITALGAAVVAVTAVALMWVAPLLVVRRRRLRPLPDTLAGASERFAALARAARVESRVVPVLGPTDQRDAFSFGAPGHYRVALPPAAAVRWRDATIFDPLVGHELAHVVHRDVALAWLTRLVWWALAPLLAVPVVVGLVQQDYSILGGYVWRVSLLAAVVALLSTQLLRSREHDADLRAAQFQHGPHSMLALVRRLPASVRSAPRPLLARHPEPERRAAVLEQPALATRTGFVDGLTGGFLAAAAMPLVVSAISPLLAASGQTIGAYTLSAALLGPMLAGSVGLGLWRAALVARLEGSSAPALGVAAGTGLGLVLGQAVSLQQAALGTLTGVTQPAWLLVSGLAGAGAVVLSAGLAHLWADVAPRLGDRRLAWGVALVANSLLFGTLLWSTTLFQSSVDLAGWVLARMALLSTLSPWWVVGAVSLLALFTAVTLVLGGGGRRAPAWLVENGDAVWPTPPRLGRRTLLVAGLAGGCGAAAVVVFRWASGAAADDAATFQRFQAYQWVAVLVAATVLVALVVAELSHGAGAAIAGVPLTVAVVLIGFLGLNTALGGFPAPQLATEFLRPALAVGFYACLLVAAPAAVAIAGLRRAGAAPGLVVVTGCTLVLAGAGATAALAGREVLVGPADGGLPVVADPTAGQRAFTLATEVTAYESEVVTEIGTVYRAAADRAAQVQADPTLDATARAAALDAEVLAPLTGLLDDMTALQVGDARLAAAHGEAMRGLELALERYRLLRDAGPAPDEATSSRALQLQSTEAAHWERWADQRRLLLEEVLGDG